MANSFITPQAVVREALRLFMNSGNFIKGIDKQYSSEFGKDGAKIGSSVKIRYPNDFTVRSGPTFTPQNVTESYQNLTINNQLGVDIAFSSLERALDIQDYSDRYLKPMMNNLAGQVQTTVMSGVEAGACNFAANFDGSNNIISPTATTFLTGAAYLDNMGASRGDRKAFLAPMTQARTVSTLAGLFNPATTISKQYSSGEMGNALGMDFAMDQTIYQHTSGSYTAGTVSGAGQTGSTLVTAAITGTLNAGDFITIAGVYGVNRVTKQSLGYLQTFVVTANVASGATSIPIYPAIVPPSGGPVQYQTVSASPASGATITLATKPSVTYNKNLIIKPTAVTLATVDLVEPKGVHEVYQENYQGINMRLLTDYLPASDQLATRLDILFGYQWLRPEWVAVVADNP